MEEPALRKDKPAGSAIFDVPVWLGDMTGVLDWHVSRRFTRRKVEFVIDYKTPHGATAQIVLRAITSGTSPSWELRADLGHSRAGIVIPARTRIKW